MQRLELVRQRINRFSQAFGNLLVDAFHYLALFVIGAAIVWSAVFAFFGMASKGHASIDDILLLAIATLVIRYGSAKFPSADGGK